MKYFLKSYQYEMNIYIHTNLFFKNLYYQMTKRYTKLTHLISGILCGAKLNKTQRYKLRNLQPK